MDIGTFLRDLGAPEEIIRALTGPSDDEMVADAFRSMETALESHAEKRPYRGPEFRTEDFRYIYGAWLETIREGFTRGGTSFASLARVFATMEYRLLELEAILRADGFDVPREPSEESATPDTYRCDFCGGNHPTPSLNFNGRSSG